jgi:hypothetical protein
MRKLLALMVLLCGAASADAAGPSDKWCSGGGTVITKSDTTFMLKGNPVDVEAEGALRSFFFDREQFFPCFIDKIMIKDQAVEVMMINSQYYVTNLQEQELAQKAWRSANKEINIEGMTVKVRALSQEEARQDQEERKAQEEAARQDRDKARVEAIRRAPGIDIDGSGTARTYSRFGGPNEDCVTGADKNCKPGLPCFAVITIEGEAARLLYDQMRLQPRQYEESTGAYYVGTRSNAMTCWGPQPDDRPQTDGQYACEIGYDAVANVLSPAQDCQNE